MGLSDLCKENNYCKTASLNACGLLLLIWTNLENISLILIFADLDLPRNCAKIGRRENFPFYGIRVSSFESSVKIRKTESGPYCAIMDNEVSSATLNKLAMTARR